MSTTQETTTHETEMVTRDTGLAAAGVDEITQHLNLYLSNLQVFYAKVHNFHWNVEGAAFFPLHEVLQEHYEALAEEIDEVAERILKLGRRPLTRLQDYLGSASLEEVESRAYSGAEIAGHVTADLSELISGLRETIEVAQKYGDEGTADDVVAMLKNKEKQLWMFDAYRSKA